MTYKWKRNILLVLWMLFIMPMLDARAALELWTSALEALPRGDVDGNGVVDMEDARLVARFVLGQVDSLPNPDAADATQDGEITMEDALAIAQSVTGISRVVVVGPVHGLPGKAQVGSRVLIEVFEKFFPYEVTGGTVRVTSPSTGYDSGDRHLTFEQDGRSLYYHWDTSGRAPAPDYEVFVNLTGPKRVSRSARKTQQAEAGITLVAPVFQPSHLAQALDAFASAPGFPLQFRRVFAHDYTNAPYLGPFGRGWQHSYNLFLEEATDGSIAFFGPNGFNRFFQSNEDGTYTASPGDYGQLFRESEGTFVLRENDGFLFRFFPAPAPSVIPDSPTLGNYWLDFMEDPNGNRVSAIYQNGRLSGVQSESSGQSFNFEYNERGFISKLTDHVGRVTSFAYVSELPHLLTVTAPGGRVTQYAYLFSRSDATDHRLLSISFPDDTFLAYAYDEEGRLISEERAGGIGRIEYAYEENGATTITDAVGSMTTVRVDEDRNPITVVDPMGNVTFYDYDENSNLTDVTDALGRKTSIIYDDRGNAIQITDPERNQLMLDYELQFNQLTALRDSRGNVTSFSYNSRGNLTQILYPDGFAEKFSYDGHGSLATKVKRDGQVIAYNYNDRGLLFSKGSDSKTFTYTYDANGNLTRATNTTGTINIAYNAIDQLTSVTYPGGRTFSYKYNAVGQRTRVTDPDGRLLVYTYDTSQRLTQINDESGMVAAYQYDDAGHRTRKILGNGVYTTYAHDAAGQILSLVNFHPAGEIISRFDYTYNAIGNRLSKSTLDGKQTYTSDVLNQLTGVTYPDGTTTQFVYDAMGNRLNVVENGMPVAYTSNDLNQYLTVGSATYTYDANGNLIRKTQEGETTTYEYDFEDRLVSVQTPTETIINTYNALGQRNTRSDAEGTVRYLWDGNEVSIEENNTNTTLRTYVWGGLLDEVARMEQGGIDYYYLQDALLSVSDLIDDSGNTLEQYRYRAFGEPLVQSSLGNPWFFTGAAFDFKTGLQSNRLRWYSPDLGRFINPDPINLLGGVNLYAYASNNPARFVDPFGIVSVPSVLCQVSIILISSGAGIFGTLAGGFLGGLAAAGTVSVAGIFICGSITEGVTIKGGNGSPGGGGGPGGGTCPTFIQTTLPAETIAQRLPYFNMQHEQLVGKLAILNDDTLVRANIPIFGVAGGKSFKAYRVEYGSGSSPTEWRVINSSTTPQHTLPVDIDWTRLFHGDAHLYGNLGDWNTGLQNWIHFPCNPPEDTTDVSGVYTIRLIVEGKGGETVEDRVTVEVGRVLAQALPGTAVSPDRRVTMRFPEQALTHPFRIYSILPLDGADEAVSAAPKDSELIGSIYRIREPGDRFSKDVTLEFSTDREELSGGSIQHVGLARYDVLQQAWLRLSTTHMVADGHVTFRTVLTELPTPKAIYSLVIDTEGIVRSEPEEKTKPLDRVAVPDPQRPGTLVLNTFETTLDQWKSRDRFVGALLERDSTETPDGSFAVKLINENQGGNFSVTAWDKPFDVRDYPVMSFDYRIGLGVKTDFYLLVNGRWYNLGFTDDPNDFRNRDVNIANLSRMENIVPDDQWHAVSINLYEHLRTKTRHTQVEAIVMADWDVGGYMKLTFGNNARNATYYLDNFKLSAATPTQLPATLVVNTFDTARTTNLLDGPSDLFSNPGTNYCQAVVVADSTTQNRTADNRVLQLSFDVTREKAFCGYWTALKGTDLEEMRELSFRLHTESEVLSMLVGLRHAEETVEARVPLAPYVLQQDPDGWQTITIPLSAFRGYGLPDLSSMDVLFFIFSNEIASGKGAVLLDNLEFHREPAFATILDFDRHGMTHNLLGGGVHTSAEEAAVIATDHHEDRVGSPDVPQGTARISYGGTIGHDFGGGQFSYAAWETDLMGFDARKYDFLVLKIRGQQGGEQPNIYLDDGTTRRPMRAKEFSSLTSEWQEIHLPLEKFAELGVDLSHLEGVQLIFEWEEMSGTLYVAEMRFEESVLARREPAQFRQKQMNREEL